MNPLKKLQRIEAALAVLSPHETCCTLCPRDCRVNRRDGEKGICQSGNEAAVSNALLHFGEEPVLSGTPDCAEGESQSLNRRLGSGTIFFAGCNLKCSFCQNYQLSWLGQGRSLSDEELSRMMLDLQEKGALNINLVSPTHIILPILRALKIAYTQGLSIPLVYNSNGYEKVSTLAHLESVVDVYLPDLKYLSPEVAKKFSCAADYFDHASLAIREMNRQRPAFILNEEEIALKGLIVRHLILPGHVKDSLAILKWLSQNLPLFVPLSLMSQYHPCFRAPEEIQRPLRPEEYREVLEKAEELEFENMFIQPENFCPDEHLIPDFSQEEPFRWGK